MARSKKCSGCARLFTSSGYWSHLAQTSNPICKAILNAQLGEAKPDFESEHEAQGPETVPFGGDAFGSAETYMDDDFGQALNSEPSEEDDDGSSEGLGRLGGEEFQHSKGDDDNGEEDAEHRRAEYELEVGWEPPRAPSGQTKPDVDMTDGNLDDDGPMGPSFDAPNRLAAEDRIDRCAARIIRYLSRFPLSRVGSVVSKRLGSDARYLNTLASTNPFAPFRSEMDWKVARWAKLRGPGSTAFSELLAIDGVREALKLSYKNTEELNKIIDTHLPSRPRFKRHEVIIAGEAFELFARDIVECLRALWGDPDFLPFLVFEPEEHYTDDNHTIRLFHDMHTGIWWWDTQMKKSGITIVPIIISSDKTQVTVFHNKLAYPVFLTIGNLPKHIRRKPSRQGQVLLAYLPTAKLNHITNKAARRRATANLFHACMSFLLKPLETLGRTGLLMASGDGAVQDCHPILAGYCGDYQEQVLVTCTKSGECPTCPVLPDELGDPESVEEPRQLAPILQALDTIEEGPTEFTKACKAVGIKPIQRPFWQRLPFRACGAAEIDARCRRLPPNHNIRLFLKGISHLNRVTGTEHDQMCRFILGIIIDIRLPSVGRGTAARLVRAVRGLLDFLYLTKYPVHSKETLDQMEEALFFGTTDNFNTEYTERLNIDFAKDPYRATNSKDEYPQMTAWLDRREKVLLHEKYISRRQQVISGLPLHSRIPPLVYPQEMKLAKYPSVHGVSIEEIETNYGAMDFRGALRRFIIQQQHPEFTTRRQLEDATASLHIPFHKLSVYHRIKFISHDPFSLNPEADVVVDSIHCEPSRLDKYRNYIPPRFDTAVIRIANGGRAGVQGYCVGQIRCVFILPLATRKIWFSSSDPPTHLAYVDWFMPFASQRPARDHGLHKISRRVIDGRQRSSIIPVNLIRQSAHLIPAFGPVAPVEWKSSTVLETASDFYFNCFSDRFPYSTIY
ncbi:hypothetical protein CPB83DRAFT_872063 [Crepidotus variabilis]|uniref:Uncharacterized protein n=1 Tax=Crepidotus variabilis TaxID=179855 RepID=A0A9P6JIB3_9AGAR|nr:hypothetical protein CPB83DRAFT_872063 [Crepidotus variabilis]